MERLEDTSVLRFNPDTLRAVRAEFGLERPGEMDKAVETLVDWLHKQHHFNKKDFSRRYLEISIIMAKGSLERAKERIDSLCTMRTLLPQYFGAFDIKRDMKGFVSAVKVGFLPRLTKNHERVFMAKIAGNKFESNFVSDDTKFVTMMGEYLKLHDYPHRLILVYDFSELDVGALVQKLNLLEMHHEDTILMSGYGVRIKEMHIISSSKVINLLVNIFKKIVSAKIAARISVHRTIETVFDSVPKDMFPKDYGGEERSLSELSNELINALNSRENMEYLVEMSRANTDESRRLGTEFNDQYLGMPGSFRALTVD